MIKLTGQQAGVGFRVCFGVWGVVGLAISLFAMMGAPMVSAIYVTLMWMGGVLFFGLAALMCSVTFETAALPVYVVDSPADAEPDQTFHGIPYRSLPHGEILGEFPNGKFRFRNWNEFIKAAAKK